MSDIMLNVRLSGDSSSPGAKTTNRMHQNKTEQHNVALKFKKRKRKKFTKTSEQSIMSTQRPSSHPATSNRRVPPHAGSTNEPSSHNVALKFKKQKRKKQKRKTFTKTSEESIMSTQRPSSHLATSKGVLPHAGSSNGPSSHNVALKFKKQKRKKQKRKKFTKTSEQSIMSTQRPSSHPATSNRVLPHAGSSNEPSSHQQQPLTAMNSHTKASKQNLKPISVTECQPSGIPCKYLAMDCEMVGSGPKGSVGQLGRCSIVSYEGDVVYDEFVKPSVPVTDYRTRWSGIRAKDLSKATPYHQARKEILKLLVGKVVIGHAVHNDFQVLQYSHPAALTRDTSRIPLLNQRAGFEEKVCASLKRLTKAIFNRDIQMGRGGHSSVEDARATMELYKLVEDEWEKKLALGKQ